MNTSGGKRGKRETLRGDRRGVCLEACSAAGASSDSHKICVCLKVLSHIETDLDGALVDDMSWGDMMAFVKLMASSMNQI